MEMVIGQQYRNWKGEVHKLTSISKNAVNVSAENLSTGEIVKFRFYKGSGK